MRPRGTLILLLAIAGFGGLIVYGGFSKYQDQHSGVPGKAKVSDCTQGYNTRYVHKASTCTGSWVVGGSLVFGNGHVEVGEIDGADSGDEGKTIDVRIHGDHATVPDLKTPIALWVLGTPVLLFGLYRLFRELRPLHN